MVRGKRHFGATLTLAVAANLFAGCAGTGLSPVQVSHPAPSSYRYTRNAARVGRKPETNGTTRVVKASWYGSAFSGRRTSSGERFDPNALTAASPSLPLGCRVRVTNVSNGRSVIVRINDRGPHVRGRSLDLSRRAAQKIGLSRMGVGRVIVTRVNMPSDLPGVSAL
jgi:peptidoglycan lytic transglycosylase